MKAVVASSEWKTIFYDAGKASRSTAFPRLIMTAVIVELPDEPKRDQYDI